MTDAAGGYGAAWSAGLRRGTDAELRGWVEAGLAWCDESDAIALAHFRRGVESTRKADRTFVTVADTAIERLVRERIADAFPGHGVVGEEYGVEGAGASVRWFVDPIDGTHNYLRGVPLFGTLLAAERDGELQACVVSAPALRARWFAWRGGGAWTLETGDGGAVRRISVSEVSSVDDAHVLYASATEMEDHPRCPGFGALVRRAWRERGFGDFWGYTLVAEGAAEVMAEVDLKAWDSAAPTLLVEEAGGRVTDFDGRRALDSGTFLATNGILHEEVRRALLG
jgi:histidinol-phosphatase